MDLVIFYSPDKAFMTYYINNDSAGYKIEYPFSSIDSIELETLDEPTSANGVNKQGHLVIKLNRPPNFYMDSSGQGGFYQCMDFTEGQQASEVLTHYLGGHAKTLAGQLSKLTTLEVFANRHAQMQQPAPPPPMNFYDPPTFTISAPVSPQIVRPASSNAIIPEINFPHQEHSGPQSYHKHKRQRSRSVPLAVDFAALHQSMPSFSFQDVQDHQLFAPVPQHLGNNLRIDTSHADFLDYRPTYPLSAATTTSPSDYASPSILNANLQNDMNGGYGSPYNMPWISPLADSQSMMGASVSPLSMHGDPHIASPSPPLTTLRGSSVEYQMHQDPTVLQDDGLVLSELYSKQSLALGSPGLEEVEDVDFMQQFPLSSM